MSVPVQLALLPTTVHLERIDADARMARYYRLALMPDLFGGCASVREWGRTGISCRPVVELHASEGTAQDRLLEIARAKRGRG